jgi:ionotropic glutamate receptor
LIYLFI